MSVPSLVRYWRQDLVDQPQNFGDFLSVLLEQRLFASPLQEADAYHLIGSVLSDNKIRDTLLEVGGDPERGRVLFWGCGLRQAQALTSGRRRQAVIRGVRGPLSRRILDLPEATPLGDPALLLPLIVPLQRRHGATICVTHFHEQRDPEGIRLQTGVDQVHSAAIPGSQEALLAMVERIAGASFVLAGALHAAIVACAYGTPFAFFDSGYVNLPFKWADFAASLGIPCRFSTDLACAHDDYRNLIRPALRLPSLSPLLLVAPFAVRPGPLMRALVRDRLLSSQDAGLFAASPGNDLAPVSSGWRPPAGQDRADPLREIHFRH